MKHGKKPEKSNTIRNPKTKPQEDIRIRCRGFGEFLADWYFERLKNILIELEYQYDLHPECRHLATKGEIYRNIIFGKYLVIYRITPNKVEVLTMLHTSRSVTKIKTARSIKF